MNEDRERERIRSKRFHSIGIRKSFDLLKFVLTADVIFESFDFEKPLKVRALSLL